MPTTPTAPDNELTQCPSWCTWQHRQYPLELGHSRTLAAEGRMTVYLNYDPLTDHAPR